MASDEPTYPEAVAGAPPGGTSRIWLGLGIAALGVILAIAALAVTREKPPTHWMRWVPQIVGLLIVLWGMYVIYQDLNLTTVDEEVKKIRTFKILLWVGISTIVLAIVLLLLGLKIIGDTLCCGGILLTMVGGVFFSIRALSGSA